MADPNEAGTPPVAAPVSESAGTGVVAPQDGSESSGKPIDAGLLESWKPKVEGYNDAVERAKRAEQRLAELESRMYAAQQPANPLAQTFQNLAERAQYGDTEAQAVLAVAQIAASQQQENQLTKAMIRAGVPANQWDRVEMIVRNSGFRTSVEEAVAMARGSEAPVLQEQLKAKEDEIARLKAALDGRTVNGAPKVSISTAPAPVGDSADEMAADEYMAIMRRGGQAAIDLRNRGVRIKLQG